MFKFSSFSLICFMLISLVFLCASGTEYFPDLFSFFLLNNEITFKVTNFTLEYSSTIYNMF